MCGVNENVMGESSGERKVICLSLLNNCFLLLHWGGFSLWNCFLCAGTQLIVLLADSVIILPCRALTYTQQGIAGLPGHPVLWKITHLLPSRGSNTEMPKICGVIHIIYISGSLTTLFSPTWPSPRSFNKQEKIILPGFFIPLQELHSFSNNLQNSSCLFT